jgi:hypothetical protein
MFMTCLAFDAASVDELFERVSEGLRSVAQVPTEIGMAELALDQCMRLHAMSCKPQPHRAPPSAKANSAWNEGGSVGNDFVPLTLACLVVSGFADMFDDGC